MLVELGGKLEDFEPLRIVGEAGDARNPGAGHGENHDPVRHGAALQGTPARTWQVPAACSRARARAGSDRGGRPAAPWTWQADGDEHPTTITIRLNRAEAETHLLLTHDGFTDEDARNQNKGGHEHQLDRLDRLLATTAPDA